MREAGAGRRTSVLAALGGIQLAILLGAVNATSVATALPAIANDLDGFQRLSWVVTAYLVASTISAPLYGRLSDAYGRRTLFLAAIGIVLVASVLAGSAQSMEQLVACRVLQGLGGGGLVPLGLAAIGDLFPPRVRGRYQGYVSATFAAAAVLGPLVGGVLTDHLSWRWVFFANVPVAVIAATAIVLTLPSVPRRQAAPFDALGALLLAAVVCLLEALLLRLGHDDGWWGVATAAWGAALVAAVVGLVLVERRARAPLIPLALLRARSLAVPVALGFLVGGTLYTSLVYAPVLAQGVLGASATGAGSLLVPLELTWSTTSVVVGYAVFRTGRYRVFPTAGAMFLVAGMVLLAAFPADAGKARLVAAMLLVGCGMGLCVSVLNLAAQNAVPHAAIGTATGLFYFATQTGSLVAVGATGGLLASRFETEVGQRLGGRASTLDLERIVRSPREVQSLGGDLGAGVRAAMLEALHWVFSVGLGLAVVAVVVVLLLRNVPLRRSNDEAEDVPTSAPTIGGPDGG